MSTGPDIHPPRPEPGEALLRYFAWEHLPPRLQGVSRPFADLAAEMAGRLPAGPERTVMLRKLLESKDCAVRAAL